MVLCFLPNLLQAQNTVHDSLPPPGYHQYSGYAGIGFPLGFSVEGAYRPVSAVAFSLGGYLSFPVPYVMPAARPSLSVGLSFPVERMDEQGYQNGLSVSMNILAGTDNFNRLNTFGISYGSMPGSQPVFNWKIGAMFFLLDHATTFLRRIEGLPILSISWRVF